MYFLCAWRACFLLQVGIYMNQVELAEFVDQLDEDGGGKIEMDEVVNIVCMQFGVCM